MTYTKNEFLKYLLEKEIKKHSVIAKKHIQNHNQKLHYLKIKNSRKINQFKFLYASMIFHFSRIQYSFSSKKIGLIRRISSQPKIL